jgi:hypothetical protein
LWVYDYVSKKATIYLTYKPVNNNINVLLRRSKVDIRARYKKRWHTRTALFKSCAKSIRYVYQVDGNAATNSQFYATDSTKHFVTGSVYFMQSPILTLLCLRPVILKWHAAFNGDFKMEVILSLLDLVWKSIDLKIKFILIKGLRKLSGVLALQTHISYSLLKSFTCTYLP